MGNSEEMPDEASERTTSGAKLEIMVTANRSKRSSRSLCVCHPILVDFKY